MDGFCLDDDARFVLPDPDPDNTGTAEYQVWLALAGKPGGGANLTTCKVDTVTNEDVCSLESTITISGNRDPGKPRWVNVSKELLTLCLDTDGDGVCDTREFPFDTIGTQYLWQYDNFGNGSPNFASTRSSKRSRSQARKLRDPRGHLPEGAAGGYPAARCQGGTLLLRPVLGHGARAVTC